MKGQDRKNKTNKNLKQRDKQSFGLSYYLTASGCDHVREIEKQRALKYHSLGILSSADCFRLQDK